MNKNRSNKLFYKQNKTQSIYNIKQSSRITKKTCNLSKRLSRIYILEYRKKFHKQNLIYSLLYNTLRDSLKTKLFFKITKYPSISKLKLYDIKKTEISTKLIKHLEKNAHHNLFRYKTTTLSLFNNYSAFINGFNLWPLHKQTTPRKVFPQTSTFWYSNYLKAIQHHHKIAEILNIEQIINNPHKIVSFIKIRRKNNYFSSVLHSRKKFMYWSSIFNYNQYNKFINLKLNQYSKFNIWSIPCYTDTLYSNILVKSSFLLNTSSCYSMIRRSSFINNGSILIKTYSFIKPGSIFSKLSDKLKH